MVELSEIVSKLTCDELEELIKEAQQKIERLKNEDQIRLISVSSGILVYKWFLFTDKEKAIAYAHERLNKELECNQKRRVLYGEISIDTQLVPKSEVGSYLRMNND